MCAVAHLALGYWKIQHTIIQQQKSTAKTRETVKTGSVNMNYGYEARNILTVSQNVAQLITNNNYNLETEKNQNINVVIVS